MHGETHEIDHPSEPEWPVLDRYLAGIASAGDIQTVQRWLRSSPHDGREMSVLRSVLTANNTTPARTDLTARADAIVRFRRTDPAGSSGVPVSLGLPTSRIAHAVPARPIWRWVVPGGVALAAIVAVCYTVFPSLKSAHAERVVREYTTRAGEQANVQLPDGSHVMLAPATKLRYLTTDRGARTVDLEGQAYFTVSHDSRAPFTVRTGRVTTRVLGTAFDVRAYAGDVAVRVVVADGKVAVHGVGRSVTLTAGTIGEVTDSTVVATPAGALDAYTGWTRGALSFERTPVPVVLETLSRWYGYEFRLADSIIAKSRVTAVFDVNKPTETMGALEDVLNVTMTMRGRVVTLSPKRARGTSAPAARSVREQFTPPLEAGK